MIALGRHGIAGDLAAECDRQRTLLMDLEAIASGVGPTPDRLAAAPLIDHWVEAERLEPCLVGQTHGHPRCRAPYSVTSGLVVWAPELSWMRTVSRYYRLGRPLAAGLPN